MMPAAKHGDPQIGVDIHLCVVPPSPSPVPLPTPHMSIVFDPFDYLPILGATVTVCGMKRAVAGTSGKAVHIPPGFPFAPKMPDTSDEIFMGSATVVADGDPFSFLAVPVLSCQVAGMISPPRLKKKEKKLMLLPTVTNLAIPTNVFIGGPPTISLMGMAFKLGFAALGKFAKSKLFKSIRKKLFGKMKSSFLKCKILRAEPVDITTGEVSVEQQDFILPGRIPIDWVRTYTSNNTRRGACGHGWETPADIRLEVFPQDNSVAFLRPAAASALFPEMPATGDEEGAVLELWDGALLSDRGSELQVRTKENGVYHFKKGEAFTREDGVREYPINRISDLCGNWLEFERHGPDVTSIKESAGRRIEIETEDGLIRQLQLFVPSAEFRHVFVQYQYDDADNLVAVLDALGNPYTFAYDDHRLIRHTDRNRLSFYYEFARHGDTWRVVHSWGDGGLYDYRFEYLDELKERRITNSLGHVSLVKLDERNLPISEIDPLGGITIFEYDEVGRTAAVIDPNKNRTEYHYDQRGNLLKLIRPDSASISGEFDTNNKLRAVTDEKGAQWIKRWDARGLLTEEVSPLGNVTRYEYDVHGQMIGIINPRGARSELSFDSLGNVNCFRNALGHCTTFTHDAVGNLTARVDPLGLETSYQYDSKGKLTAVHLPSGATVAYAYDAEGNLTQHRAENGTETRIEYFGQGQIARRIQPGGTTIEYVYDTEERLIGVCNQRGERYRFIRDPLGRTIEEIDYWGQTHRYAFDACGHLISSVDPLGQKIGYTIDPLGRVLRKLSSQGMEEEFSYDARGNVTGATNAYIDIVRVLDLEGRVIKETQGDGFTIENAYDAAGNRVSRTTSLGNIVTYEFDLLDQVIAVGINTAEPVRIKRNEVGQATYEALTPHLDRHLTFGPDGLLAGVSVSSGSGPLFILQYEYDAGGNLTRRIDSKYGVDRYGYDLLAQVLTHLDPQGRLDQFVTDAAGDPFTTRTVEYQPRNQERAEPVWQRRGQLGRTHYVFDRAGDLIEMRNGERRLKLLWDANHRLIESHTHNDTTTYYTYDPLGRRLCKQTGNVTTVFFWDGHVLVGEAAVESNGSASIKEREYIYYQDNFEPLALITGSPGSQRVYYYHNDPSGCPTRVTDSYGKEVWSASYNAFGATRTIHVNEVNNPIRLMGQYFDCETGLCCNGFRYFDGSVGQFITQDPMRLNAGPNLYSYAPNVSAWIDPLGLKCFELPSWKKVQVDWEHIAERHMTGGALTAGRTIFTGMSKQGVMGALRRVWPKVEKVATQGERLLIRGFDEKSGHTIEMWYNKTTKLIETAYPVH